jgi:membrane complex biogenesis BtpA family protein
MTATFRKVFGDKKPIVGMVHLDALPGAPLFDEAKGVEAIITGARKDLLALQKAGFDAVMFGNENDRPYEFAVDAASTATMAYIIGRLKAEMTVPFGVNILWDPMSTMALAAATGAAFMREIMTGSYASDMGPWNPDAGKALRYRNRLGRKDLAVPSSTISPPSSHGRWIGEPSPTGRGARCSRQSLTRSSSRAQSPERPHRCRTSRR